MNQAATSSNRAEAEDRRTGFGFEHEPDEYQQEYSRQPAGDTLQQRDEPRAIRRIRRRRRCIRSGITPLRAQLIRSMFCHCCAHAAPPRASGD